MFSENKNTLDGSSLLKLFGGRKMKAFVISMIIILMVFCTACSKPNEHGLTPSPSTSNITQNQNEQALGLQDVPEQIIFYGIEEYNAFAASVEFDEPLFQTFIQSKSYDMNGICTKVDAVNALNVLNSMPFPIIEGFYVYMINLRFDTDSFYVFYKSTEDDTLHICFDMRISISDEGANSIELDSETIEIPIANDSEMRYLIRAKDNKDQFGIDYYYFSNIRSHWVRLITNMSEEQLLDVLQSCRITTIDKYEE